MFIPGPSRTPRPQFCSCDKRARTRRACVPGHEGPACVAPTQLPQTPAACCSQTRLEVLQASQLSRVTGHFLLRCESGGPRGLELYR